MKIIFPVTLLLFFTSCNLFDSPKKEAAHQITDTSTSNLIINPPQPGSLTIARKERLDTISRQKVDTASLMKVSTEILKFIKTRSYKNFALFIHPSDSLRFSPYAFIHKTKDRAFTAKQFLQTAIKNVQIDWNSSWDEENPELLTVDGYFKKFVYDVDFLNAKLKSINRYHSQGTDLNNITEVYPDCDVVEFFFPGFDKKYGGLDFRGLRLVFKATNKQQYLVGIVHDQWTP